MNQLDVMLNENNKDLGFCRIKMFIFPFLNDKITNKM